MNQFKNLNVWKKSITLAKLIYQLSDKIPSKEKFGIIIQMTRCAVSIASNIAEGAGRKSNNEFAHFLSISHGSCYELETQLIICNEINYLSGEESTDAFLLLEEIQKMLYRLQIKLKNTMEKY
jgi:four helix bundle protein